jgi:hypothetical protein
MESRPSQRGLPGLHRTRFQVFEKLRQNAETNFLLFLSDVFGQSKWRTQCPPSGIDVAELFQLLVLVPTFAPTRALLLSGSLDQCGSLKANDSFLSRGSPETFKSALTIVPIVVSANERKRRLRRLKTSKAMESPRPQRGATGMHRTQLAKKKTEKIQKTFFFLEQKINT